MSRTKLLVLDVWRAVERPTRVESANGNLGVSVQELWTGQ